MKKIFIGSLAILGLVSCNGNSNFDAQGTFEATEVIVSAESNGRIIDFDIQEGENVSKDSVIGAIDSVQLDLQRKQLKAQQSALLSSRPDVQKQLATLREQIEKQKRELNRVTNLLKDGVATQKQQDDIITLIKQLESQESATLSTLKNNRASIDDNVVALNAQIASLDDRIQKCKITSPIKGTILTKYAEKGEYAIIGKPLMKVANLDNIYIRAYITSSQLHDIAVGDSVDVIANFGSDERHNYKGRVMWISSESEFTPKSIQTNDSRANLVYAVKIAVKNDGRLKIGVAGEVKF